MAPQRVSEGCKRNKVFELVADDASAQESSADREVIGAVTNKPTDSLAEKQIFFCYLAIKADYLLSGSVETL